ncbi:MAG TPA: hypothetical protein VLG36_01975 [Candidatus Chromulinivoraceae bacterium]|nr:hypothetical protein [Candidatus Chromulinivoraceae bacterium]
MTEKQQIVYTALSDKILGTEKDAPILIAINGKDGSGKTMMADILADFLSLKTSREIIRISVDDFMNSRAIRYTPAESAGRGCYEYTFNFDGFIDNVLKPLQKDGSWEYRSKIFDHATDAESFSPIKKATKDAIVIIDGVFLYKNDLVNYWDLKILLDTDDETVIERGARRDTERLGSYEVARQKYIDRYIASQTIYYNEESPQERANIIIDNNNVESPFITKASPSGS